MPAMHWGALKTHGYIWNNLVWPTFILNALPNVEIPFSQCELMYASCEYLFVSVDGADVWVSCSLFFFFPLSISMFFVLAVVQGLYVMLMRAPHLEKCHWDAEFAELTLELKNSVPVKDIGNWGHQLKREFFCAAGFFSEFMKIFWLGLTVNLNIL